MKVPAAHVPGHACEWQERRCRRGPRWLMTLPCSEPLYTTRLPLKPPLFALFQVAGLQEGNRGLFNPV